MFDPNATKALIKDCDSCAVGVDAVVDRLDGVERCPPIQGAIAVVGPRIRRCLPEALLTLLATAADHRQPESACLPISP